MYGCVYVYVLINIHSVGCVEFFQDCRFTTFFFNFLYRFIFFVFLFLAWDNYALFFHF